MEVMDDPFSYEEVQELARSDWRLQVLWGNTQEQYQYDIIIDYDDEIKEEMQFADRELVTVSVVLSDVKPIAYVLN